MALDAPHKAGPEEWRERHVFLKAATEARRENDGSYSNNMYKYDPLSPEPSDSLIGAATY